MTKNPKAIGAAFDDVCDFHRAAGQPCRDYPVIPNREEIDLRIKLIREEVRKELLPALEELDDCYAGSPTERLANVADAIADSIYVQLGTAAQFGIPIVEVWQRVHASNMAKLGDGVHLRHDGKVLKPPGWEPPDVVGAIEDAMRRRPRRPR